mmetsp:Transcript_19244/g.26631  ORF Transcript_19244/g.26631 Transcript_19244/m.26631 type:complete len:801 (-) Transcript_19244:111-2513(-)|eukprot:CAMPEP_0196580524 /NCGR_PEP_ID=MMETSP1081-20130531/29004_1 /TAXON_ID=36882 /ORGANISM="Pyramimonas amylifera, Strain CCMP720" /LENGTH=800 /DNA_ID=CAMNT_0041900407 /DNA_START=88 /DNA_END=2490 /DNA_ORIENTATION=+
MKNAEDGEHVSNDEGDFTKEENILKFVRPNRWMSINIGDYALIRCNWVVSLIATIFLWGFVIYSFEDEEGSQDNFGTWQSWITQNFTWFYIGTQDVWALFLFWLMFSKYAKLKLGKDHEKPEFNDITWFAMLFACGIGVGLFYYGVGEPMYYYRQDAPKNWNSVTKLWFQNDDQRAQMAMFITFFHWGLHAWVVYIVVALLLAFVCYRWDMPMTIRSAFYPLVGDIIYGTFGDLVDSLSIACTTFGVCTSLGLGVQSINTGLHRLNTDIPYNEDWQVGIIWVITAIATISVITGLKVGIRLLSLVTFFIGVFLMLALLFLDNTWYLLNTFVQSTGVYIQYVWQIGFDCEAYQQLSYEFQGSEKTNQLWGSGTEKLYDRVLSLNTPGLENDLNFTWSSATQVYEQTPKEWMDWWTIFYWGWWISWAPFVGMFVAKISRGRTIRQVIVGSFLAPTTFSFLWMTIFGGLGIKMERVAELTLGVTPDVMRGTVNCTDMGYVGGVPTSPQAIALSNIGYYAAACRNNNDLIYDIMEPYGAKMGTFLQVLVVIGVILYFITSSDSGSYVDDTLASGGFENPPILQKVYWAFTEGACATALIVAGGDEALASLQAASICAGFPYTLAICFMCTSLYRAILMDTKDPSIMSKGTFCTGLFDFCEGFMPLKTHDKGPSVSNRALSLAISIVCPSLPVYKMSLVLFSPAQALFHAIGSAVAFYAWIILLFCELDTVNCAYIGWVCYIFFVFWVTYVRIEVREQYNIYGNALEDFFGTMTMYPWICSQMELQTFMTPSEWKTEQALFTRKI